MCQVIRRLMECILLFVAVTVSVTGALGAGPPVRDDPLVRMPGTQPGQVTLQSSTVCYDCHGSGNPNGPWNPRPANQRGRTDYEEYNI